MPDPSPTQETLPPRKSRPCLLLVDDTPENIDVLFGLLKPHYDLKIATRAEKALKLCDESHSIDLILLDIMMPGMDGYEVCRILKSQPHTCDIPILFITAKSEVDDIVKGFELGGTDYLTKPFRPAELLARVRTQLLIREQQAEIAQKNTELKELLQILCHDVANHFMVLQMSLELADMKPEKGFGQYLPNMRAAVRNGNQLTQLVREMRRTEDKTLHLQAVDLPAAIQEVLLLIEDKLKSKGRKVCCEIPTLTVLAEPTTLVNSVLGNLLTNAIKFSHSGGELTVRGSSRDGMACISIRDHGVGMSASVLEHLFDVGKSHSRVGTAGERGTGFGMPLMHRFVRQFGGHVEVVSREQSVDPLNHGTEFTIWLKQVGP